MSDEINWKEDSPLLKRDQLRICQLTAIKTDRSSTSNDGTPITRALNFGRLESHVVAADVMAPTVIDAVEESSVISGERLMDWQCFRIRTSASQVVDIRIVATSWESLTDAIDLLEGLYYGKLQGPARDWTDDSCGPSNTPGAAAPFHQLVFVPDTEPEPSWETVQRLIYRADLDAIEEQSSIGHPSEINRRPGQLAAVGRYASVMWSVQNYIESSAILSASLAVAALECIRTVRLEAIERYQGCETSTAGIDERTPTIAELEAELTFGAESSSTILPILQSLRADSYHTTLIEAANVNPQAALVARMLDRLKAVS